MKIKSYTWNTGLVVLTVAVILTACLLPGEASADARRFAWVYESGTALEGTGEYEQWVTWKTDKETDDRYYRLEFRQEFEYGLTDRLQVGLYFANWRHTRTAGGSKTMVRTSSLEAIYNLSDPTTQPFGAALYGEVSLGQEKFSIEGKLLLEKLSGPWSMALNLILESEWEEEDWAEDKGVLEQTAGISYQFSPRLFVGAELLNEMEIADWSDRGDAVMWAGPNLALRGTRAWVLVSPLFQITDEASEPSLMVRTLVGFPF
jgi:hypothetical protein